MTQSHPARKRLVSFVVESVVGTGTSFVGLSFLTGAVLVAGFNMGITEAGYVLVANAVVATILTQHSYWDDGTDDDTVEFEDLDWIGRLAAVMIVVLYLNVLVATALVMGIASPSVWSYGVVGLFVFYDMLSVQYGIPLSVTGVVAITLAIGFTLGRVLDDVEWQELDPTSFIFHNFGRRSNPR